MHRLYILSTDVKTKELSMMIFWVVILLVGRYKRFVEKTLPPSSGPTSRPCCVTTIVVPHMLFKRYIFKVKTDRHELLQEEVKITDNSIAICAHFDKIYI
jgi:hypothetical protein